MTNPIVLWSVASAVLLATLTGCDAEETAATVPEPPPARVEMSAEGIELDAPADLATVVVPLPDGVRLPRRPLGHLLDSRGVVVRSGIPAAAENDGQPRTTLIDFRVEQPGRYRFEVLDMDAAGDPAEPVFSVPITVRPARR